MRNLITIHFGLVDPFALEHLFSLLTDTLEEPSGFSLSKQPTYVFYFFL